MRTDMLITSSGGTPFEDGVDRGRVLVFGHETGGRYSMMEFIVSARRRSVDRKQPDFGPHYHKGIEETFLVKKGNLQFLLGDEVFTLSDGDFVRVPPGVRHGFANLSDEDVELLVSFHPGGFEQLFVTHRSDQTPAPSPNGFVDDAIRLFASEFEV